MNKINELRNKSWDRVSKFLGKKKDQTSHDAGYLQALKDVSNGLYKDEFNHPTKQKNQ